jgi:hypothetical protein
VELAPGDDAVDRRAYELRKPRVVPEGRQLEFWVKAKQELAERKSDAPSVAAKKVRLQ